MIRILFDGHKILADDNGVPVDPPQYWLDDPNQAILNGIAEAYANGDYEIVPDPLPPQPLPDWNAFNSFMLTDTTFNNYCNAVFEVNKNLTSALLNAYSLVATNGIGAFVNIWSAWCGIAQITDEHRNAFANTAESLDLPSDFVAAIRGQR